jgi:coenzyme F420-reducing hydrogenase gamma subunit
MGRQTKPKLAIWKFTSCNGCQLQLVDCDDDLLAIAALVEITSFVETPHAEVKGPYDLSLVEGSITTAAEAERIHQIRRVSRHLVTIGACAAAGGIQALRNFRNLKHLSAIVYPHAERVDTLQKSTPVTDHVFVDFELNGCPINRAQLLEVIRAFLHGRQPNIPRYSVCLECARRGNVCVMVAQGIPCLGPVTQAGCGAICPAYARGCYGCFGPQESPNTAFLSRRWASLGVPEADLARAYRNFTPCAEAFRKESEAHED